MKMQKTKRPASGLPLTDAQVKKSDVVPDEHEMRAEHANDGRLFDLESADAGSPPEVTTRVIPAAGRKAGWQVEVAVAGGRLHAAQSAAIESVRVDRALLAKDAVESVRGSVPPGTKRLSPQPRIRKLEPDYTIRFGDLQYEPTTIFAPDGRRSYYDMNYPWRCLVRITTPRGWSGSGVLIGPRHVVTASHCVDWTPGWLRVDVLFSSGSSLASAAGTIAYCESKVGPGSVPDSQSDEDYAVIVLDQPLGLTYGWLGSRTYNSSWDDETSAWHSIGYPQDLSGSGDIAAWQTGFYLNELGADYGSARLIRSQTFDNWPGQSGSPVFGFWGDGPHVVGVVSGQGPNYNYISGGSLLPSLIHRARTEHP